VIAVALAGMVGTALDLGQAYLDRRALQASADLAADAGAQLLAANYQAGGTASGPTADAQVQAVVDDVVHKSAAGASAVTSYTAVYTDGSGATLAAVGSGTIPPTAAGVAVTPTDQHPTTFIRVLGITSMQERATAATTVSVLQSIQLSSPFVAPYAVWWQNCQASRPLRVGDHAIFRSNAYGTDAACNANGYTIGSNNFKGYFHQGPSSIANGDTFTAKGGNALGQEPLSQLSAAYTNHTLLIFPVIDAASGNGANLTFHDNGFVAIEMDADYSQVPPSQDWTGTVVAFIPTLAGLSGCTPGSGGCTTTSYTPIFHGLLQ